MGFFDKLRKKEETPPDFSSFAPASSAPVASPGQGSYGDLLGKDPLASSSPYETPGVGGDIPGLGATPFDHEIFSSSDTPTSGDKARAYAQSLSQPPASSGQRVTYGGAISGHEAELILERLDTIKAEIDSVKQRMIRIERFLDQAEQKQGQRRYF